MALLLNVTRHPYSFIGDRNSKSGHNTAEGTEPTWHEALLAYTDNSKVKRFAGESLMSFLGWRAGIKLDYHVQAQWQPVDSQRTMLWAGRFGKQEAYMSALARRHFEERKSASHRSTILEAVEEIGLEVSEAKAFLDTDELKDQVWLSYGSTIREKGIHAIPFFVFNSPLDDGGPFRSGKGDAIIVNGSGDEQQFLEIFEQILGKMQREDPERWSGLSSKPVRFSPVASVIKWWCTPVPDSKP